MDDLIAGRYIERDSLLHRLDPRAKLALLVGFVTFLLVWPEHISHLAALVIALLATALARIPARAAWKFLYGVRFFALMAFLVHLLFTPGEGAIEWWIFKISLDGASNGILYAMRLFALIWAAALLGWTTTPVSFADGIERLAKPLARIKIPVRDMATMLLLAMRFLPTMLRDARELRFAQEARGAKFGEGSAGERVKSLIPLLIPLFTTAFRRAEATAMALTARGYVSHGPRTSLYPLKFGPTDAVVTGLSVVFVIVAIVGK